MEFNIKNSIGRILLFDNADDCYYDKHTIVFLDNQKFEFSVFNLKRLDSLENDKQWTILNSILKFCPGIYRFEVAHDLFGYRSKSDLPVFYEENDKFFCVLSLGEFQPGRYKIFLEGIFKKPLFNRLA